MIVILDGKVQQDDGSYPQFYYDTDLRKVVGVVYTNK